MRALLLERPLLAAHDHRLDLLQRSTVSSISIGKLSIDKVVDSGQMRASLSMLRMRVRASETEEVARVLSLRLVSTASQTRGRIEERKEE